MRVTRFTAQRTNWFKRPGATLPVCYEPARDTTRIVSLDKHFVLLRYLQYIYSVAAMNCLTLRVNVGLNKTYIDTSLYIYYKILDITLQYLFL